MDVDVAEVEADSEAETEAALSLYMTSTVLSSVIVTSRRSDVTEEIDRIDRLVHVSPASIVMYIAPFFPTAMAVLDP